MELNAVLKRLCEILRLVGGMTTISMEGRSTVDVCLDILDGKYAPLLEMRHGDGIVYQDDRELQMSACYFLASNAQPEQRITDALLRKLIDDRDIHEYVNLNEGYCGSDYYVFACAAEALAQLGYEASVSEVYSRAKRYGHMPQGMKEQENYHEFWSPRILGAEGDSLVLLTTRIKPSGITML